MSSEYDPLRSSIDDPLAENDLERVQDHFQVASQPYLSQPWSWLLWALILPSAALATPRVHSDAGAVGVLLLWSVAVIVGGFFEAFQIAHARRGGAVMSTLAGWVLRAQGNLSLVAVLLSIVLVWREETWLLPGLWLLLLGHSLFSLGGLAARALRTGGLLYQLGGLIAIWPHGQGGVIFAAATLVANLWIAASIWRARAATG